MEVTYGRISQSQILETVLQSDRDKIKTTLEKIDADAFDLAVDTILQSKENLYCRNQKLCTSCKLSCILYESDV